jgi:restriction endonuclease S subunit
VDSLIGVVPDGWKEYRLEEVCGIIPGPSVKQLVPAENGSPELPVVTPRDLQHNRVAKHCATHVAEETARGLSRYRLQTDDIVCARTGHLGRQGLVSADQAGWLTGSGCLRLRTHRIISARYLVYYLAHPAVRDWIVRNAGGSVIPTLSTKMIGSLPVVIPSAAVQAEAADILSALDDKILIHDQISCTTAVMRDAILLRLLTGTDPAV